MITSIPALGHNLVTVECLPATCDASGLSVGAICERCNVTLTDQETIKKLEHSFSDWNINKEPTCISLG